MVHLSLLSPYIHHLFGFYQLKVQNGVDNVGRGFSLEYDLLVQHLLLYSPSKYAKATILAWVKHHN